MTGTVTRRVEALDSTLDAALERVRGRRVADIVFHAASTVGDFSLIWHVCGLVVGLLVVHDLRQAAWFSALIGLESLVVNQGIKRLFRRARPTETGDPRFPVRKPRTSSFPSGHASSAFYAATLLIYWVGWPWAALWLPLALIVATSRAFVRIHHPSDVLAGMVVGQALAWAAIVTGLAHLLR